MATHEDDRAAYLAGEDRQSLAADERAELDELRGLLGSTAAWAQPSADLEDRVVTAIAQEAAARPASPRVHRAPLPRPIMSGMENDASIEEKISTAHTAMDGAAIGTSTSRVSRAVPAPKLRAASR